MTLQVVAGDLLLRLYRLLRRPLRHQSRYVKSVMTNGCYQSLFNFISTALFFLSLHLSSDLPPTPGPTATNAWLWSMLTSMFTETMVCVRV
jgi:hypothetical protein